MKFMFAAAAVALATSVFAAPAGCDNGCLAQSDAESIVNKYISILSHNDTATANATAQALLADDYQEISDSILSLEGLPLGGVTFSGKQLYINGVLSAEPVMGINTLEILVAGCTKILWYWKFLGIGSAEYEVKGFNLISIDANMQIETVNLEFNSIAWGLDTGYQIVFPTTTK